MKSILIQNERASRWAAMLLATIVAIITCLAVANAAQTITTPNAVTISYNLAAGANSAAITPVTNKSVLVMGCCTTSDQQGVGQVSLLHVASLFMVWSGYESNGPMAFTGGGFTQTQGTHIVFMDLSHHVDIQIAGADTIRVHNGSTATATGNVTLIW